MGIRAYLVTKEKYGGFQRKIAWFNRLENGIYFDFPFLPTGSHISFHKNGTIWNTRYSTGMKAEQTGCSISLDDKSVWVQLGISVVRKSVIDNFPILKNRDKRENKIYELDLTKFPSDTLNFVVECIHPEILVNIPSEMNPPEKSEIIIINDWEPYVVITILGHENNQLIQIMNGTIRVRHINERYSASRKGVTYNWEAIGEI